MSHNTNAHKTRRKQCEKSQNKIKYQSICQSDTTNHRETEKSIIEKANAKQHNANYQRERNHFQTTKDYFSRVSMHCSEYSCANSFLPLCDACFYIYIVICGLLCSIICGFPCFASFASCLALFFVPFSLFVISDLM